MSESFWSGFPLVSGRCLMARLFMPEQAGSSLHGIMPLSSAESTLERARECARNAGLCVAYVRARVSDIAIVSGSGMAAVTHVPKTEVGS